MNTPAPPPYPGPPNNDNPNPASQRSFLTRLFDTSFSEFITPSIVKVLYIIGIVLAGLAAIAILISSFSAGGGAIVGGIIAAPLVFFLYVMIFRVLLEVYMVLFKIEENTRK